MEIYIEKIRFDFQLVEFDKSESEYLYVSEIE